MKLNRLQVKGAGEHYVTAEIYRQGGYATPFQGNMPHWDLVAIDVDHQRHIDIQVKTKVHGGRWAADIRDGRPRQEPPDETRFWVLVDLSKGAPEYYVVPAWWMVNSIYTEHQKFLDKHGGKRPRSPDSTDHSIKVEHVEQWKDRWDILGIFGE